MSALARLLLAPIVAMLPVSLACIRGADINRDYDAGYADFCHGLACPEYSVVSSEKGKYEERLYQPSKWVSTEVLDLELDAAVSVGFRRLFNYISGDNEQGEKIAMTAPVTTRVIPGQGPACETNFTVSFFVAPNEAATAPNPTDPAVFFTNFPGFKVYVRSFGGFARQGDWLEHAAQLGQDLRDAGLAYDESHYYTAGYDSPYRLWGRHNEVWFPAIANQVQQTE